MVVLKIQDIISGSFNVALMSNRRYTALALFLYQASRCGILTDSVPSYRYLGICGGYCLDYLHFSDMASMV
jgi:hypothetical protein